MRALPQLVLALIAAGPPAASADEWITGNDVRAIGGGYQVYFGASALRVRKGRRSAPLRVGGGSPRRHNSVEIGVTPTGVTLTYLPACVDVSATFTHDQLEARLDNAAGIRLLHRGRAAAAVSLFERATMLDPGLAEAPRNRAAALVQLGRQADAIAALMPALTADPIGTYVRVALDGDLAPLGNHPALTRLHAATPGSAQVDAGTQSLPGPGLATAPGGRLASVEFQGTHGACSGEIRLVIRDGPGQSTLAAVPLAASGDYDGDGCRDGDPFTAPGRGRIRARVAVANRILAELGFSPVAGEAASTIGTPRAQVNTVRFARRGLGLVIGADGAVRVFRRGRLLVEHPPGTVGRVDHVRDAVLLLDEHTILVSTLTFGCEWAEDLAVVAVAIP